MQIVSAVAQSIELSTYVYHEPCIEIASGKYVVTLAQTTKQIDAAPGALPATTRWWSNQFASS